MALTWLAGAATERPSGRAAREVLDEMARGPLKARPAGGGVRQTEQSFFFLSMNVAFSNLTGECVIAGRPAAGE